MNPLRKILVIIIHLCIVLNLRAQTVSYSSLYDNASIATKTIDVSKPVGCIDGNAGTSPLGGSTYIIPIKCPPGTNGMSPNISVVYNSQGGNGIMGQGWNLSGLSAITRAGWDQHHHAKTAPVKYDNSDVFVIDGEYLYKPSGTYGTYGSDGATYKTENESYSVTTSKGSVGGCPDYFTNVSKDGTIKEYGHNATSKFYSDDGSKIILWRISRIIDINGNYIEFEYDNSDRDARISKIKYTGHTSGMLPYNEIYFQYEERSDKNIAYDGGYTFQSKYLLTGIQIKGESEVFKNYHFYYGKNSSGSSFLKRIDEFASDGSKLNDYLV